MKKQNRQTKRTAKKPRSRFRRAFARGRYLPALAITLFATHLWAQPYYTAFTSPQSGVLAKATNISHAGLLSATNSQRNSHGAPSLTSNGKLNSAAQAKANHMVTHGYWSHVAPDGTQPWWFITNAGYQYLSAGENLAYGFMSSSATVTGWMNSPSHKSNMLNATFTEVGFGFADTDDYVYGGSSHGPQTVVVAMYAKPQVAAAAAPAPQSTPAATQPKSATPKQATAPAAEPKPSETAPAEAAKAEQDEPDEEPIAVLDSDEVVGAAPTKVSRVQLLTGGGLVWSATFVALAVCSVVGLWLLHKGFRLRRYVLAGEKFVVKHLHLDLTVLSIIYLGFVLLATTGTIR